MSEQAFRPHFYTVQAGTLLLPNSLTYVPHHHLLTCPHLIEHSTLFTVQAGALLLGSSQGFVFPPDTPPDYTVPFSVALGLLDGEGVLVSIYTSSVYVCIGCVRRGWCIGGWEEGV